MSTCRKRLKTIPTPRHLSGDICETDEYGAKDRDHAGHVGFVPVTDKVGHGVVAELPEVGRDQQCQQDESPGPSHQVDTAGVSPLSR